MISQVISVKRLKIADRRSLTSMLLLSVVGYSAISETTTESLECGGGSFINLFILSAFLLALPTLYMEIFLGQYTKRSATMAWRLMPISIGVWYYLAISAFFKSLIMSINGAKLLYYLGQSAQLIYPWDKCPASETNNIICYNHGLHKGNLSIECVLKDGTINCPNNKTYQLPTHLYLWNTFFNTESEPRGLMIGMIISLLIYWILIFLILYKSMYNFTKFVTTFSSLVFVWLVLVTVITLCHDGSVDGIAHMFVLQQDKFIGRKVWFRAASFSIYYFSIGMPATMAFASRLQFDSKPIYDAILMVVLSGTFSLMYTSMNYSIMGRLAYILQVKIAILAFTKSGISFGVIPYYMSITPSGHVLLFLYYFIASIISVLHVCICISGIIQNLLDSFELREWRKFILAGYVTAAFLLVIPTMSKMGFRYYFPVLRDVIVTTCSLLGFLFETLVVFWLYATSRLSSDILFFTRKSPTMFWKVLWRIIPAAAIVLFVCHVQYLHSTKIKYNNQVFFWAVIFCGIHVSVVPILGIIISVKFWNQGKLTSVLKPAFDWGPPNKYSRRSRKRYHADKQIRSQVTTQTQRPTVTSKKWQSIIEKNTFKMQIPNIPMQLVNKPTATVEENFRTED